MYNLDPVTTIHLPAPVTSLAFGDNNDLYAGAQDGSIRLFDLPGTTVVRALRGLKDEVASIVSASTPKKNGTRQVWAACGNEIHLLGFATEKLVLSPDDALMSSALGMNEGDSLNELSLSANGSVVAFTSDDGFVGVMDVASRRVSRMKTVHANIASTVNFVPDRVAEIVSGSYDGMLLHFDHNQGSVLSKHACGEVAAPRSSESGTSLSPPFIICSAMSSTGALAAGTADGRLWVGLGGEKGALSMAGKKKARKWGGLSSESALALVIAEGPVVGVAFTSASTIVACSLLGTISHLELVVGEEGVASLEKRRVTHSVRLSKVNALASNGKWLAIGGFNAEGKGVAEIWAIA